MSRQAQNLILGGLVFAIGTLGMVGTYLYLTSEDGATTAGAPLAPAADSAVEVGADQGDSSTAGAAAVTGNESSSEALTGTQRARPEPLAVTVTVTDGAPLITTSPVSSSTTASPAAEADATTIASTTPAPTTVAPTTVAPTTVATVPPTMVDTSMPATTEPPADPAPAPSTEAPVPPTTATTEAPAPTSPPVAGLNDVELEITRLTNELRTNPNGPLRREGPVIDCGGDVSVTNGQYDPLPALTLSEVASLEVARPWSVQMSTSNFEHRPRAGVNALQEAGISVGWAGENIAYNSYPDKAMTHFAGWRESDGHFCNMMSGNFTHIGVGEDTHGGISYATQNFFSTR